MGLPMIFLLLTHSIPEKATSPKTQKQKVLVNEAQRTGPSLCEEMGKALRTIRHFYSCMDHPEHPHHHHFTNRTRATKSVRRHPGVFHLEKGVNKDSDLPSPCATQNLTKKGEEEAAQRWQGKLGGEGWKGSGSGKLVARMTQHEQG